MDYAVVYSPYLEKGTVWIDHEAGRITAHDMDDAREFVRLLNERANAATEAADAAFLKAMRIQWP